MKRRGNLKEQMAGRLVVSLEKAAVAPRVTATGTKLPYERVKEAKPRRGWMSDEVLYPNLGSLSSMKVVFDGRGPEDARKFAAGPLAPKMNG